MTQLYRSGAVLWCVVCRTRGMPERQFAPTSTLLGRITRKITSVLLHNESPHPFGWAFSLASCTNLDIIFLTKNNIIWEKVGKSFLLLKTCDRIIKRYEKNIVTYRSVMEYGG